MTNLFEPEAYAPTENVVKDTTIKLKKVTLQNYRNIEYKEYVLDGNSVLLEGINGLGKTNVLEGIFWALSGNLFNGTAKTESQEIIPYGAEKDAETSVKLEFTNNLFIFERKVTQQWSRDKETYKGLKTVLLVNNAVSKNQNTALTSLENYLELADITNKFSSIPDLAKLNLFELVYNTDSLRKLDYKVIRAIITDMVGEVDFKEIISGNQEKYNILVEPLRSHGLDLVALKSNTRSKIFDKNNGLEVRVKSLKDTIKSYETDSNIVASKDDIEEAKSKIAGLDIKINDLKKQKSESTDKNIDTINNKITTIQNNIYAKENELRELHNKATDLLMKNSKDVELKEKKGSLSDLRDDKITLNGKISDKENQLSRLNTQLELKQNSLNEANDLMSNLKEQYKELENPNPIGKEYSCPECGSIFDISKTKEYQDIEKTKIGIKGQDTKQLITGLTEGVNSLTDDVQVLSDSVLDLQEERNQLDKNINLLFNEVTNLEKEVTNQKTELPQLDLLSDKEIITFKNEIVELGNQKEELKTNSQQVVINIDNKIQELENEKEPFNEVANAESTANSYSKNAELKRKELGILQDDLQLQNDIVILIKELEKEMYEKLDKKVSNIFGNNVEFKLYKLNVSNGEYDTRMCEIYVRDIKNRFVNIKTINTGMFPVRATEIISKIKEHYNIPKSFVFVDELSGLDSSHIQLLKEFGEQVLATKVGEHTTIKEIVI